MRLPNRTFPTPYRATWHAAISDRSRSGRSRSALECLLNRESERRLISVDPNIRPFLVGDRRRYEARLQRFFEQADMIKASVEDLGWLYPNQSPDACAARFMSWGARLVTVAWTASGHAQVKAPRVTVVDTVGAGDSFQAALFAWLRESGRLRKDGLNAIRSEDLKKMLTFAATVAALTCSKPGCQPPRRHEVGVDATDG